jgi:hypothetical protein
MNVLKCYSIGLCANVLCKQAAPLRTSQFADVLSVQALEASVIINPLLLIFFTIWNKLTADWLIANTHRVQPQVRSTPRSQTHARTHAATRPTGRAATC